MLIGWIKEQLDDLHIRESEHVLRTLNVNSIRVRAKAVSFRVLEVSSNISLPIPNGQVWIFYSASLSNDSRSADPLVRSVYGHDPGSTENYHVWPTPGTTPGAGQTGNIINEYNYPQVMPEGSTISITDLDYIAGDVLQFTFIVSKLVKGVDYLG